MSSDSHLAAVQRIYEAFGRGDVPAILDELADDVEWEVEAPSYGIPIFEPGAGKDHVEAFFGELQGIDIQRFSPTNFLVGGNQVAVPIDFMATVRATGNVVETLEIHLWTFGDDGKVIRFLHVVDRHAFHRAYGL